MLIRDRITELRRVPASKLLPNPKNWRTHPKAQQDALRGILAEVGIADALLARETPAGLQLIDGHLRADASPDSVWPVLVLDVTDQEADKLLASIDPLAAMAEPDPEKLAALLSELDTESEALQKMLEELADEAGVNQTGEVVEDEVPEPPAMAVTKPGDLWLLGQHRLICGDSTKAEDVARLMAGTKAALCFTSPPYSDLRDYDGKSRLEVPHLAKMFDWPAATFIVNLGLIIRNREIVRYWDEWIAEALRRKLPLRSWCVWDKGNASAPAHQQAMFGLCHEWVFVFGEYRELELTQENKHAGMNNIGTHTVREKDGTLSRTTKGTADHIRSHRQLDSVVRLPSAKAGSEHYADHPAQFPVAFAAEYVSACSIAGDIVCEPFCGSGTTLIAAEQLGRKCYGMEICPAYCDVIVQRWENLTGKKAKLDAKVRVPHKRGKTKPTKGKTK